MGDDFINLGIHAEDDGRGQSENNIEPQQDDLERMFGEIGVDHDESFNHSKYEKGPESQHVEGEIIILLDEHLSFEVDPEETEEDANVHQKDEDIDKDKVPSEADLREEVDREDKLVHVVVANMFLASQLLEFGIVMLVIVFVSMFEIFHYY